MQMDTTKMQDWASSMQAAGMNTVEVTAYAKQGIWNSDDLQFSAPSPATLEEIRVAKERGMKVVLILRTKLDTTLHQNDFLWHGMIFPEREADLKNWFSKYQQFTTMWSRVAEKEGIDMVVLGSELSSLFTTVSTERFPDLEDYYLDPEKQIEYQTKVIQSSQYVLLEEMEKMAIPRYGDFKTCLSYESRKKAQWANATTFTKTEDRIQMINDRRKLLAQHWIDLILHTRTVYAGKLSLASNFDNYKDLTFWSYLDCMSINAYFPLRTLDPVEEETMLQSWLRIFDEIDQFRRLSEVADRPVFFTELGYTEYAGSTLFPWAGHGFSLFEEATHDSLIFWKTQPKALDERNDAVNALVMAVKQSNFPLQGVLYWQFASHDFDIGVHPFGLNINSPASKPILSNLASLSQLP